NVVVGALLLWVVPLLLPEGTPLLLRAWIGLIGTVLLSLFALFDLWVIFYRLLDIGVEKLWFMPGGATSLADFWGRRWNRVFSGMVRDLLFTPLTRLWAGRRWAVPLALLMVFLYSGFIHENVSVAIDGRRGGPTLYFLIQYAALMLEHTATGK